MYKILITGRDSYIGVSFENYLKLKGGGYLIDTVDTKSGEWETFDFSRYDTVFHVAGIAHVSSDPKLKELYYKVNRDLAVRVAEKAKSQGVKQFVFMSSIIVYGSKQAVINKDTPENPDNFYGDSKLQADLGLSALRDESFKVVSVRPPVVYGKNSKGNFPKLIELAGKTPLFPDYQNKKSMIHIDNLCEFIRLMIENGEYGVFYPQNSEYMCTSELVRIAAERMGKRIIFTRVFNFLITMLSRFGIVNKVFGDLVYEMSMSEYKQNYRVKGLSQSVDESI